MTHFYNTVCRVHWSEVVAAQWTITLAALGHSEVRSKEFYL